MRNGLPLWAHHGCISRSQNDGVVRSRSERGKHPALQGVLRRSAKLEQNRIASSPEPKSARAASTCSSSPPISTTATRAGFMKTSTADAAKRRNLSSRGSENLRRCRLRSRRRSSEGESEEWSVNGCVTKAALRIVQIASWATRSRRSTSRNSRTPLSEDKSRIWRRPLCICRRWVTTQRVEA